MAETLMLKEYFIFLGMVYSLAALGFVIWFLLPLVWNADIKPRTRRLIEEMLGPRGER